jgi:hypothetical protein
MNFGTPQPFFGIFPLNLPKPSPVWTTLYAAIAMYFHRSVMGSWGLPMATILWLGRRSKFSESDLRIF